MNYFSAFLAIIPAVGAISGKATTTVGRHRIT